nr:tRNA lysidine(34) synthetase TilS [Sphingobium sp. OAS761]
MTSDADGLLAGLIAATAALVEGHDSAHFGIAVSGGPDSMALLDLAMTAFPGRVAAITVDHGLRPEAAAEARAVALWCARHTMPHTIAVPDDPVSGNVQAWARAQRYRLIERWRVAGNIDWIMTAHHADDQLETLLMRLNRGAGVGGLAGVRGRSGRVIRPLLGVRKAALLAHVRARGLPHAEDPSNADPRFDRASLRAALGDVAWLDREGAVRSAAALAEAEAALEWTVEDLAKQRVLPTGDGWSLDPAGLPREYLRRLLLRMIACAEPEAKMPRGEALDRAIATAARGEQASLGNLLLKGGPMWVLTSAPPRR